MVASNEPPIGEILVADDDPICRRMLDVSLSKWGFEVQSFADGEESCRVLLSAQRPRLAVLDWNMPKLDGLSVCRNVRERWSASDVYILMLTGRTNSDDLACALEAGANDFVRKPFDAKELRARLLVGQRLISTQPISDQQEPPQRSRAMDAWMDANVVDPSVSRATQSLAGNGYLTPVFDPQSLRFNYGIPSPLLRGWQENGTLQKVLLDRVQVCPKCRALPSFRFGCASCGSGCVTNERLIHHFACAHVGRVEEFEKNDGLECPKCLTRQILVGADYEYLTGPYRCLDCGWSAAELEHVAHCLACQHRFPASESVIEDLVAYHCGEKTPARIAETPRLESM